MTKLGLFFYSMVMSSTFHQASGDLQYKIMPASQGTSVELIANSVSHYGGMTHPPPLKGAQAIFRVASHPITFDYDNITLTASPTIWQVGDTIYWRHHPNLIQKSQVMWAAMPTSPHESTLYDSWHWPMLSQGFKISLTMISSSTILLQHMIQHPLPLKKRH